jgi:hypothetical protein
MSRRKPTEIEPPSDVQPAATLDDTEASTAPAVQPAATLDDTDPLIEASTAPAVIASVLEHHRIGGNPGVRVTQHGLTQHVRVTGNTGVADHRAVPIAVLAQVQELLEAHGPLSLETAPAAETLRAVRDLLAPWL